MVDGGGSSFRAVNSPNPGAATSDEAARPPAPPLDAMQGVTPSSNGAHQSPEPAQQSTSHSSNSLPAAERDAQPSPPAAPSPAALPPAQSQPATSSSTPAPAQTPAKDETPTNAGGYGTRSRNRPSAARINYAEDIEMDFEIPATNGSNGTSSERTTRSPAGGTDTGQSPAPNAKKPAATTNGTTTSAAASRDPSIPGTLTFSANPNANVGATTQGKKRKAGGAHAAASATAAAPAAPTAPASRRKETTIAANMIRETNMMTFEKSGSRLKRGKLEADDGTLLAVDDHVYLVCEPPGEPYYLCRIMEFLHTDSEDPNSPIDSIRVNWFYRPRDVLRYNNDTRLVYGTMHSDICPLTSLRGKCYIRHRSEIADFDEFRRTKDSFWFNQVFDRFIHRWYEVIPVSQVINVPEKVKKALDERWKFVVVETSRVKELTSAVKTCKRCSGYCAANDSVECAVCHNTYHMNCVRPPLLKKPSRGFAWACGPCGRAQERKLEARRTPIIGEAAASQEDEEVVDEEEEDPGAINTTAPSPSGDAKIDDHPATQAEIALAKMWPMRYLGIHCRVEDALQYDDRAIYPRASSRLGPRHQANVNVWHGRPVELVKPAEIRKRYNKGPAHKKDPKLSKEDLEADRAEKAKRPKWVQDEPAGYVRRGEDFPNADPRCTAKAIFKMPSESVRGEDDAPADREKLIDDYMSRARSEVAKIVGVQEYNTNFLTKAIELLYANNYDSDAALEQLKKVNRRKDLREPEPNKEEKKRFEEGVAKYGSELRNVRLHVRTMSHADVVRYYYLWKKTPKGKEIWGHYDGRKGKNQKVAADSTSKLVDDIADDVDDSAFDFGKAEARKKSFVCKFCSTKKSRQWRRAPGVAPGQTVPADGRSKDKGTNLIPGLCQRCARLWRKYAIKYEDAEELIKKISAAGGKKWRKLIDQEVLDEINAAQNAPPEAVPSIEPVDPLVQTTTEPPRKKQKGSSEKDTSQQASAEPPTKKKTAAVPPKPPTPPPQPVMPKMRELPCAVCLELEPLGDQRLVCRECRLTVHRQCYGVTESRSGKWVCDQCKNDKKETVSYTYECVLCPVKSTEQELIEPPKVSHKKKTDKEREKERLEKELRIQKLKEYQQHQRDKGRPELPREPLKKTAENNWVHLHCAVWTPELKFTNPKTYELVEGVGTPTIKYDQVCKICKTAKGACVSCHQCHNSFHVGCAHSAGYTFGFDVTPVKSSRRDAVLTFTLGQETGSLSAAIWCKDHTLKTIIHPLNEVVDESGTTALQLYVQNYKQADQTLTGTARKANLLDQFTKNIPPPVVAAQPVNRRTSTVQAGARSARNSSAGLPKMEEPDEIQNGSLSDYKEERKCEICDIGVSPKWWRVEDSQDAAVLPGSNPDQPVNTIESAASSIQPSVGTPASQSEGPRFLNGIIHPEQPGVPKEAQSGKATTPDGIPLPRAGSYLCNKCHWRRKNKPELLKPPPKKSPTPPPQPVRSPPRQYPPSAAAPQLHHWPPITGPPHASAPLPGWGGHPPPPPISNGVAHSPQPGAPPPPPIHHPYHPAVTPHHPPANGYPPYSAPPGVLPPAQPSAIRSPYPPPTAPTPLHHTNSPMLAGLPNGIHSPHTAQFGSPAPGHIPTRQTESPFSGLYGASHNSPGPLHTRPETPRDGTMAPQAPHPPPPQPHPQAQPNGASGASASPNLRNLLH